MTKTDGARGLAARAFGFAAEQIQNAATQVAGHSVSKALVRTAEFAGLPETRIGRAATSALRLSSAALEQMNPNSSTNRPNVPQLPTELLENVADQLDRKTLTSFARSNGRFAGVAGGAVRDVTFKSPAQLRDDMAWMSDDKRPRFRGRGLESLTLTHAEFDAADLNAIPGWARNKLRTIVLERPLTDAGWKALENFPDLCEVRMQQSDGYGAQDLARLPKSLTQLHLRMPASPQALKELEKFRSLKRVDVTLERGATLDDVLAQFGATPAGDAGAADVAAHDAEAVKTPLHGVRIAALTFPKDEPFDEADLAKLPVSLGALNLPRQVRLSANGLGQLARIQLRSLEMNHAQGLSGATLQTLLRHPTLRHLRSEASNLNASDAKAIAASPRMTEVELKYNDRIGDEGIRALIANTRIEVLDIGRCGASDRLAMSLYKTPPPHVRSLNLTA